MKMFKAAWDKNKTEKYINQIYQRGVWAVVHNDYYVFTVGHIPSGVVLNLVLKSEEAINLCRELSNVDENFDSTCEFGEFPKFCNKILKVIKDRGLC